MTVSFGKKVAHAPMVAKKDKNIRVTKDGNLYYHTNMGKKVGTGVGVASTVLGAAIMFAMTRNVKSLAVLAPAALKAVGSGFLFGAVVDGAVNHHQKKKADAMAPFNVKV